MKIYKIKLFIFIIYLFCSFLLSASTVEVVKSSQGWELLVDGEAYFVKGVCFTPVKVGEDPN